MSGFVVDLTAMQSAVARTETIAADFDAALTRLRRDVDDVLSSRWCGAASAAFASAWQQWDAAAVTVVAELARIGEELARTGSDYRLRDQVSAAVLRAAS